MENEELIRTAMEARKQAYAPYSKYRVGAALLTKNGEVIKGCNIENASYGATNCAERTAFFKAVSEGKKNFAAIAVIGGEEETDETEGYAYPCGICRQVMREFCDQDTFRVLVAKSETDYEEVLLAQLLPNSFGPEHLSTRE
ncbi:MAG: cytidine deaminase [Lachnospiraceae bacterium]